jgi:hypothetical protein
MLCLRKKIFSLLKQRKSQFHRMSTCSYCPQQLMGAWSSMGLCYTCFINNQPTCTFCSMKASVSGSITKRTFCCSVQMHPDTDEKKTPDSTKQAETMKLNWLLISNGNRPLTHDYTEKDKAGYCDFCGFCKNICTNKRG